MRTKPSASSLLAKAADPATLRPPRPKMPRSQSPPRPDRRARTRPVDGAVTSGRTRAELEEATALWQGCATDLRCGDRGSVGTHQRGTVSRQMGSPAMATRLQDPHACLPRILRWTCWGHLPSGPRIHAAPREFIRVAYNERPTASYCPKGCSHASVARAVAACPMASRRDQIQMSDDELRAFLDEEKVVTCATIGPNGRPHLMPLWYVVDGDAAARLDLREVAEGEEPGARPARHASGRSRRGLRGAARRDDGVRRGARARRRRRLRHRPVREATRPASTWAR